MLPSNFKARIIIASLLFVALCIGVIFLLLKDSEPDQVYIDEPVDVEELISIPKTKVIGYSVEGREIKSHTYGDLSNDSGKHLLFVGGIHGGYEWNSVLLAYTAMDYLEANPQAIPDDIKVTIIPSANPDGLYSIIGKGGRFDITDVPSNIDSAPGRFNKNGIDLNRNFDCKWKSESTWRGQVVSAGTEPFSEPEAAAIRDFVLENDPEAVIFWHSQGNAVYASECHEGVLPETINVMNAYALASGYTPIESFDLYEITGDAEGWLASIGIPAVTVELETHETVEWQRNLAGIKSLLEYYSSY